MDELRLQNQHLMVPISHAKAQTGQDPANVLESLLDRLAHFIAEPTNDIDIVFTSGLYQNNATENHARQRMSLLRQEAEWRIRFEKLLSMRAASGKKSGVFDVQPSAFAYVSWDEQITSCWKEFSKLYQRLHKTYGADASLREVVDTQLSRYRREPNENTLRFLFEEIAITALWVKGYTFSRRRLRSAETPESAHIVYPGKVSAAMRRGLELLLDGRGAVRPMVWIDTSEPMATAEICRFGRASASELSAHTAGSWLGDKGKSAMVVP